MVLATSSLLLYHFAHLEDLYSSESADRSYLGVLFSSLLGFLHHIARALNCWIFFFFSSKARPSYPWGLQTEVDLGLGEEIQ